MQIIQSIRDKGAAITVSVIVLCLIGFVLMDAKQGNNRLFGSLSKNVGKVNGEGITLAEFNKRITIAETQEEQRTGQRPSGVRTNQLREQVWNTVIAEKIFYKEADKLGIIFTPAEFSSILLSNDPANPLLQEQGMTDPTGKLDVAKAQEVLRNFKKLKGDQKEAVNNQVIVPLKLSSIVNKYNGLLGASTYYPKWMQDKDIADNKNFAEISYVAIAYNEIPDSAVIVKDADINAYVKKHAALFKQEAGRVISYVSFSQLPSGEDSVRSRTAVMDLKAPFAADTNAKAFVARNTSVIDFTDAFVPKSRIQSPVADTLTRLNIGEVYGPYVDQGSYVLAKMLGTKQLPDSVKARHILIPTVNPQTGEAVNDDNTAKKLADSLLTAVKAGSDFAALAAQFSSDGSKDKGGDLGFFAYGAMVPEFNDYAFNNPVGSKAVVKTQFGYHVIDITNQTKFEPAYKIAYVAKEITPSDVTITNASLEATQAAGQKDAAELAKYAASKGLSIVQNPAIIKENDFSVGSLQDARQLVRWAFEAKKGEVSEPFNIGDDFIVAAVDRVYKEGVQDAETARSGAEAMVRNEKKAALIKEKLTATPTLETAAKAYNKEVLQAGADSSITFNAQVINGIGIEPKLLGAIFNKTFQSKPTPPIAGNSGVYVVKTNALKAKADEAPEMIAQQKQAKLGAIRSQINNWYEGLRKQATIKDNRSESF